MKIRVTVYDEDGKEMNWVELDPIGEGSKGRTFELGELVDDLRFTLEVMDED